MNSSIETYGGEGGRIAGRVAEGHSALPFTGLETDLMIALALALVAAGLIVWALWASNARS